MLAAASAEREAAERVTEVRAGRFPRVDAVESWQRSNHPGFVFGSLLAQRGFSMADLSVEDREVVLLRTFEGLSNIEAAEVLGLRPDAASKRFARALIRLRRTFAALGLTGPLP